MEPPLAAKTVVAGELFTAIIPDAVEETKLAVYNAESAAFFSAAAAASVAAESRVPLDVTTDGGDAAPVVKKG